MSSSSSSIEMKQAHSLFEQIKLEEKGNAAPAVESEAAAAKRRAREQQVLALRERAKAQLEAAKADPSQQVSWDFVFVFKVGDDNIKMKVRSHDGKSRVVSQREHFEQTTANVIDRLEKSGIVVDLFYSVQRDEIYCRMGTPEKRLQLEADRVDYDLQLDHQKVVELSKAFGIRLAEYTADPNSGFNERVFYNLYGKYGQLDPEHPYRQDLYVRHNTDDPSHKRYNSFFSSTDRIKLTVNIIEADGKLGGCEISMNKMINDPNHSLIAAFPLHEPAVRDRLMNKWYSLRSTFRAPLSEIRSYFGEQVAFYFGFLAFYNRALVLPALVGLAIFIWQLADDRIDVEGAPVFAILVAFWSTIMLELWKRKESKYRIRWGMNKFSEKEQPRPEFKGEWSPSPISGKLEEQFPWFKRFLRAMFSQTVVWSLIGVVIASVVSIFLLRAVMTDWNENWGNIITAIINALQIQILNVIYGKVSLALNSYENHRTDSEYENALIAKTFLFKFVNSYNSLLYIAFIKTYCEDPSDPNCSSGTQSEKALSELRQQLGTIFISLIVVNNAIEVLVPYIMNKMADRANRAEATPQLVEPSSESMAPPSFKTKTQPEVEFEFESYESTFEDFDEIVIQFGYVTLFVVVFPIAPLLALFNNVFEMRIDAAKLCQLTRRPEPRGAANIGTWYDILNVLSYVSVITNVALVAFKMDIIKRWADTDELSTQCWIFIVTEHVVLLIKFAISYFIPDVPFDQSIHLARQEYLCNVLLNGMEEEPDPEIPSADGEAEDVPQSNFDWKRVSETLTPNQYDW